MTSLREDYKEQTRARILKAAVAMMGEVREDSITIAGVAARAGVTVRTVYRHFGTRDGLLQSVWKRLRERAGDLPHPQTADQLIDRPLLLFPQFDDEPQLARASIRNLEARSTKRRQNAILECVRRALPDLDENRLRWRAAIADLLTSAYAWEGMRRLWGFNGIDSGDAAAEALQVLLDQRNANEGNTY